MVFIMLPDMIKHKLQIRLLLKLVTTKAIFNLCGKLFAMIEEELEIKQNLFEHQELHLPPELVAPHCYLRLVIHVYIEACFNNLGANVFFVVLNEQKIYNLLIKLSIQTDFQF